MEQKQSSELQADPVLKEIIGRLVDAYQPERIYLFGSKARGDAGPDSDYDLMVVVSDDAPPEHRRSQLAYRALRGTATAADVLVWTRQAFDERLHLRTSLPFVVINEGKLLYDASGAVLLGLIRQSFLPTTTPPAHSPSWDKNRSTSAAFSRPPGCTR